MAITAGQPARATLRTEDLGLAAWNLLAVPLGAALGGSWFGGGNAPIIGIVEVVAILGVIVALATRVPDAPPLSTESFRGWALAGPLIGAVGLIGGDAADRLGVDLAVLGIASFAAVFAAFIFAERLPVLPETQRRLAVTPFILVAGGAFTDFVASLLDGVDPLGLLRDLAAGSVGPDALALGGILVAAILLGSAAFYAMLVVAPRELAAPEPRPRVWLARYLVFVASALVGAGGSIVL
jgi:hypothetical protein